MSDIISARCFGCGNIIKVPAGLGGKKARCPQCTNTITIPMPNDTQFDDFVPDNELPEVAREGEVVRAEEGEAPIPGSEPEPEPQEDPSESRRRVGTSVRGRSSNSASYPRVQTRSGSQPRYTPPPPAAAPKSNTGMIAGIAMGVLALVILAVVLSNQNSQSKGAAKTPGREKEHEKEPPVRPGPQYSPEDQALVARLLDYTAAVNRGEPGQILRYYAYDPDDERKVRIRIAQELVEKKVSYENAKVTSVSATGGTVTFTYGSGGTKTLQWKQVNDVWLISELPSP